MSQTTLAQLEKGYLKRSQDVQTVVFLLYNQTFIV